MLEFIQPYLYSYLTILVFFFFLHKALLNKILVTGLIDITYLYNLSLSASVAYMTIWFMNSNLTAENSLFFFSQYFMFMMGLAVVGLYSRNLTDGIKNRLAVINRKMTSQVNNHKFKLFFIVVYLPVIIYKFIFGYLLIYNYGDAGARVTLAKQIRVIDTFFGSIEVVVVMLLVLAIVYSKKRLKYIYFAMYMIAVFLSGSRGAIVNIFLILYFFLYLTASKKKKLIAMAGLAISPLLVLAAQAIFIGELDFTRILHRVVASADVYPLAFGTNAYEKLIGEYSSFRYMLHPFTSIVGVRAYEYPVGSMLTGAAGYSVSAGGPNPQLPILNLVLWGKNFVAINLAAFLFGILMYTSMYWGIKGFFFSQFNLIIRSILFYVLFFSGFIIFFDFGYYQQYLIKGFAAIIGTWLFFKGFMVLSRTTQKYILKKVSKLI